jgi:L-fuculose-phosphate aldolase
VIHPATTEQLAAARAEVVAAGFQLVRDGLVVGTAGNVSARVGDQLVITPTGAALDRLEPDLLSLVDLDGRIVGGDLAPSSELETHLAIYRLHNPGSIVHTHPPVATALACVLDELPCIHPDMLALGGAIHVAPYRIFGSPDLASITLEALGRRRAVLLSNHGALVLGATCAEAVAGSRLLEWASGVYWRAAQIGTPRILDPDQLAAAEEKIRRTGYGRTRPRP